MPEPTPQSAENDALRDLVGLLVLPCVTTWHADDFPVDHALEFSEDGDGWNEPRSEDWGCSCEEWEGVGWVQVDPDCTGRPDPVVVALAWREHVYPPASTTAEEGVMSDPKTETAQRCICERGCPRCGLALASMGNCAAWDPCPVGRETNPDCPVHGLTTPPEQKTGENDG